MINIEDKSYQPSMAEISEFVGNPLFDELHHYMDSDGCCSNSESIRPFTTMY